MPPYLTRGALTKKREQPDGDPLLKTTQIIFERIDHSDRQCNVCIDQMESDIKSKTGLHGDILSIHKSNCSMTDVYVKDYTKINKVDFAEENFLQIMDICAYNVYRQFVGHGRYWCGQKKNTDGSLSLPTYEQFEQIRCNFIAGGHFSSVRGYGLVVCPPGDNKVNWNFFKNCKQQKNPLKESYF